MQLDNGRTTKNFEGIVQLERRIDNSRSFSLGFFSGRAAVNCPTKSSNGIELSGSLSIFANRNIIVFDWLLLLFRWLTTALCPPANTLKAVVSHISKGKNRPGQTAAQPAP